MPWVYKADGTRQCDGRPGISEADARSQIKSIIGEGHISDFFQVKLFVYMVCGSPTGICHVAQLDEEGYHLLTRGITGPLGWNLWPFPDDPNQYRTGGSHLLKAELSEPGVPFPMKGGGDAPFPMEFEFPKSLTVEDGEGLGAIGQASIADILGRLTSVGTAPTSLRDLIGYRVQIVKPGEPADLRFFLGRVNIHVDDDRRITDITFH